MLRKVNPRPMVAPTRTTPSGTKPADGSPTTSLPLTTDKGKTIIGETSRSGGNRSICCFRCQGIGHMASECSTRTMIIEQNDDSPAYEDDPPTYVADEALMGEFEDPEYETLGYVRFTYESDSHSDPRIGAARCALTQPKESGDWRRTSFTLT
ncbi:hypothetical protein AXF42_Ash002915 [Apostasia shenzhenica]|uniref:CCHC-type domain-containing protein n=1 Tax=Apostasia shenzhenica TaxID=1088818 RepID=A0A2I0A7M9_9ASPA|nr:hypothetical protein AXF42_Ash002915 [Apostasia shenzhenica]